MSVFSFNSFAVWKYMCVIYIFLFYWRTFTFFQLPFFSLARNMLCLLEAIHISTHFLGFSPGIYEYTLLHNNIRLVSKMSLSISIPAGSKPHMFPNWPVILESRRRVPSEARVFVLQRGSFKYILSVFSPRHISEFTFHSPVTNEWLAEVGLFYHFGKWH